MRRLLEAQDAYRQIAERTSRLLASINYTNEARWARVAAAATLTFSATRIRVKDRGEAKLAAVVENPRKVLGRKRQRHGQEREVIGF